MSRAACADYLGVSVRTVRHWDAGRCRVPWSAVKLLRLMRLGDLGALHASWAGWTINRNGLWSPDGKHYPEPSMRHWWRVCEQARFWRADYDRRATGEAHPAPSIFTGKRLHRLPGEIDWRQGPAEPSSPGCRGEAPAETLLISGAIEAGAIGTRSKGRPGAMHQPATTATAPAFAPREARGNDASSSLGLSLLQQVLRGH